MLILSRKNGEALNIDGKIEIKIIDVNGDKVKIGISAPGDVKVLRSELLQTMEINKDAAANINPKKLFSMLSDMQENKDANKDT